MITTDKIVYTMDVIKEPTEEYNECTMSNNTNATPIVIAEFRNNYINSLVTSNKSIGIRLRIPTVTVQRIIGIVN